MARRHRTEDDAPNGEVSSSHAPTDRLPVFPEDLPDRDAARRLPPVQLLEARHVDNLVDGLRALNAHMAEQRHTIMDQSQAIIGQTQVMRALADAVLEQVAATNRLARLLEQITTVTVEHGNGGVVTVGHGAEPDTVRDIAPVIPIDVTISAAAASRKPYGLPPRGRSR